LILLLDETRFKSGYARNAWGGLIRLTVFKVLPLFQEGGGERKMPIMSAHGQNDARGTARVLALTARDCIRDPAKASVQKVTLNNVYRLLENYRVNAFFGLQPTRHLPPRKTETISLLPRAGRNVKDVRVALERAVDSVFAGQTKAEAILAVETVLRGIANPEKFEVPSDEDLAKAGRFFDRVLENLASG
jgi:hypothetical protein